jgi:hypothetical protein
MSIANALASKYVTLMLLYFNVMFPMIYATLSKNMYYKADFYTSDAMYGRQVYSIL